MTLREKYEFNKKEKTGEIIECPICHNKFNKMQYSQAFCCGKCKDKYHNIISGDRHLYHVPVINGEVELKDIDYLNNRKYLDNKKHYRISELSRLPHINGIYNVGQLKKALEMFDDETPIKVDSRVTTNSMGTPQVDLYASTYCIDLHHKYDNGKRCIVL